MSDSKNVFEEFTNLYSLSKTLRFELKPIGNTQEMLNDTGIFEKDRIRQEKYEQTKPFFDNLHREFINECLKDKKIDLEEYFKELKKLQKDKKNDEARKEFKKISQELRTEINNHFKNDSLFDSLFSEKVFEKLKKRYGTEEDSFLKDESGNFILNDQGQKISLFDEWKNFTGYFTKYQETRKNFYKDDGTATAVATRIIDQNLKRFCENIQLYDSIKNKMSLKEVGSSFSVNLEDVFSLDYYNFCFLQKGIDEYNKILGGEVKESGEKIKGLNEIINKHKQDSGEKTGFFKLLDKQILSEKEEFIKSIKDTEELLKYLNNFFNSAEEKTGQLKKLLDHFFNNPEQYDLERIYLAKEALNTILYKWMSDEGRSEFQKIALEQNKKDRIVSFDKDSEIYKFPDFIPLALIKNILDGNLESGIWKDKYYVSEDDQNGCIEKNQPKFGQFIAIFKYEFNSLFDNINIEAINGKDEETKSGYNIFKSEFQKILANDVATFSVSPEEKIVIKNFVDSTLWIYQMGKYFAIEKKRKWLDDEFNVDSDFYHNSDCGFKNKFYDDAYKNIVKSRMLIQGYLTKKPFNTDKWKLNFDHAKLLQGFTESKTDKSNNGTQYGAYILRRKEGDRFKYFLGVSKNPRLLSFFEEIKNANELSGYERLNYYQIKTNSIYGTSYNGNYQEDKQKLSEAEVINKIQKSLSGYIDRTPLVKEITEKNYKTIKEIQSDIDKLVKENGRSFVYKPISIKQLEDADKSENPFYLFEIKIKDFSSGSKGNKNLHTLYFEELVSGKSKKIDIGNGEIFHRPKTKDSNPSQIVTIKNKILIEKQDRKILHSNRYLADKSFLHLSIILNAGEADVPKKEKAKRFFCYKFNQQTDEFLANNPNINVIGIDRGEKHLIYYAGIDQKGKLLRDKQKNPVIGSLNIINGVNYYKLLEDRAKDREKAKQDWQNIEGIKDLKKGYISLVVRKLADLMIEHNAIIVLEDLNMRFKQIRGGIEKSVYQQLEKALIDKLNFLVNKGEMDPQKAGNLLKAYQLTAPFSTFKDMGKQTGMIFYTQASYTSKTCPVCGFRPNINWTKEDAIGKIDILYQNDSFSISYFLKDFINNKSNSKRSNILYQDRAPKDSFELKTEGAIRYKWFSRNKIGSELSNGMEKISEETGKGITIKYDITKCLKSLFEKEGIDYKKNIKEEIEKMRAEDEKEYKKFLKNLSFYLYLLSNTRSSISGKDVDIINCPHCSFNSDNGFQNCSFNGDANGAYNIARKGIMILEKINQFKKEHKSLEKMNWGDLFIDIEEWDKFTQCPK